MRNFSDLPREVRLGVYRLLSLDEVFDLKKCQQNDDPIDEEDPKSAGLYDLIREFRDSAPFPYPLQFSAVIERSGVEDVVDFKVDDNPDLEYFKRNNITYFGKFTCDYETGDLYDDTGAASARGRIEVSVDHRRNVTVTGDAECDDTSYDETNRQWFQTSRTEIENWVRIDGVGLISWQLMDHINASLEDEMQDLRARSGNDEEDSDEKDETEAQDDEDEEEGQAEFNQGHHGKLTRPPRHHCRVGSSGPCPGSGYPTHRLPRSPSAVKNLVYFYLYRDRTKRAINLCMLSPAWKSPSPPTAFMNTCSTVASGLMPLYFSNSFKWLKKVGDKSSAQFRRLHIIHERTTTFQYEIIISITNENQVTIEELKGPAKLLHEESLQLARGHQRTWSFHPAYKTLYLRLDEELTEDLVETLTHRINTNETGAMGVAEFEIILERISFHLSEFNKGWDELMDRGIYELLD
ncbi:hypothetical protein KCU73_g7384, partial [Aureobasidium melanogenum]